MTRTALVLLLLLPAAACAQPDPIAQLQKDGDETYLFRSLLKFQGLNPLTAYPSTARSTLRNLVVVCLGRPPESAGRQSFFDFTESVTTSGGAVLIATDARGDFTKAFPLNFPLSVDGRQVYLRRPTPETCYEQRPDCPFAVPQPILNEYLAALGALKRVASNRPSAVRLPARAGFVHTPLLKFPATAMIADGPLGDGEVLAAISDPDPRQVLGTGAAVCVVADAGVFTNRLAAAGDTDNFAFAYFLTAFLINRADGSGKRANVLFIEDGEIRTDFDRVPLLPMTPPVPPTPDIPWSKLSQKFTDVANKVSDDVQTNDTAGRAAERNYWAIARWVLAVLAVIAAVQLLRRVRQTRTAADRLPPPAPPANAGLAGKRKDVLRGNDVSEPLREYLIGLFADWGRPVTDGPLPKIVYAYPRSDAKRLGSQIRKLWESANGTDGGRMSFAEWKDLEPVIRDVTAAAAEGRWRFGGVTAAKE